MGTYVPGYAVGQLINAFRVQVGMTYETARIWAEAIVAIIDVSVSNGVKEAQIRIDTAKGIILADMDKSLNSISEWVRYELDKIIDTFGPALTNALTLLSEAQLLGQENTVNYLDQSYGAVADSHQLVKETISESLDETHQESMNAYKLVQESIEETTGSVWDSVETIIKQIVDIPSSLIGQAISALVPAQAMAALKTGWDFITSGPFEAILNVFSNIFVGAFGTLLIPDDKVVIEYIQKFMGVFQQMGLDELNRGKGGGQ